MLSTIPYQFGNPVVCKLSRQINPARHTRRQFIHGIPDGSSIRGIIWRIVVVTCAAPYLPALLYGWNTYIAKRLRHGICCLRMFAIDPLLLQSHEWSHSIERIQTSIMCVALATTQQLSSVGPQCMKASLHVLKNIALVCIQTNTGLNNTESEEIAD